MGEGKALIELRGLRKEFGDLVAVDDLDLEVQDGEFLCFLGPSGCGKTTTLRMIAGLEEPTKGEIWLRGERINVVPPQRRGLGFVFQNYALFWHMTVFDNLAFGLRVRGTARSEIDGRVHEIAERLELAGVLETKASRLDLSAMQRVALGRTIVTQPQVLLLDEPLNNFRPGLREAMRGELKRLQRQYGSTMVYVTHDQEEAMTLGDRILVMSAGRAEQLAPPREIYRQPGSLFVAGFIGRPPMNFLDVEYETSRGGDYLLHGELRWGVPSGLASMQAELRDDSLRLGIRPEHILPRSAARRLGLEGTAIPAAVDLVQPLARKKIVHLVADGAELKMVVSGSEAISVGDTVEIVFRPDRIHLFDRETQKALG